MATRLADEKNHKPEVFHSRTVNRHAKTLMNQLQLIYTGGTVGGVTATTTDKVVHNDRTKNNFRDSLIALLPQHIKEIEWQISSPFKKLSEQMIPADWDRLANSVDKAIQDGYRGVVIAHGTDTLAFSAAALSMMLHNPPIPIVLTGANKPLEATGTDAIQNLAHAMYFAANTKLRGVFVTFAGSPNGQSLILDGVRVRKDASRIDVFQPSHGEPLGQISSGFLSPAKIVQANIARRHVQTEKDYDPCFGICSQVEMFVLYPGFNKSVLTSAVSDRGIKALILLAYGFGTACTEGDYSLIDTLRTLINAGIPIFIVSRNYGKVSLNQYGSSTQLERIGCVGLGNMTPEVALAKLMWVVAQKDSPEDIRKLMLDDIAGEFD